jgi:hypothetical protein
MPISASVQSARQVAWSSHSTASTCVNAVVRPAQRRCAITCDHFFCPSVSVVMRIVALLAARRCRCARAMLLLLISAPGSNRHTCRGDR